MRETSDDVVVVPYGDDALLVELADLASVRRLDAALRADDGLARALVDIVPAARTVLLRLAARADGATVAQRVAVLARAPTRAERVPRVAVAPVRLDVVYDGPDLRDVADLVGAGVDEVVRRHTSARYTVAFGGFMPGFAYLVGLDPSLRVPRLDRPRERVPAGSVAVADEFSAVYPAATPGGWRLLGRTAAVLFDIERDPPALLVPGTEVQFRDAGSRG